MKNEVGNGKANWKEGEKSDVGKGMETKDLSKPYEGKGENIEVRTGKGNGEERMKKEKGKRTRKKN